LLRCLYIDGCGGPGPGQQWRTAQPAYGGGGASGWYTTSGGLASTPALPYQLLVLRNAMDGDGTVWLPVVEWSGGGVGRSSAVYFQLASARRSRAARRRSLHAAMELPSRYHLPIIHSFIHYWQHKISETTI